MKLATFPLSPPPFSIYWAGPAVSSSLPLSLYFPHIVLFPREGERHCFLPPLLGNGPLPPLFSWSSASFSECSTLNLIETTPPPPTSVEDFSFFTRVRLSFFFFLLFLQKEVFSPSPFLSPKDRRLSHTRSDASSPPLLPPFALSIDRPSFSLSRFSMDYRIFLAALKMGASHLREKRAPSPHLLRCGQCVSPPRSTESTSFTPPFLTPVRPLYST